MNQARPDVTNTPRAPTRKDHLSALAILASRDPDLNVQVGGSCATLNTTHNAKAVS